MAVETGTLEAEPRRVFNLNPGFAAREFRIRADAEGRFAVRIRATESPRG